MQVALRETSRTFGQSAHRPGGIGFVSLLTGTEGSPDNYELVIASIDDEYSTPRHRHNFDQVRIMLAGEFGFGRDHVQKEGSIGYFCEGTYYEQHGIGHSETLLLQVGGASGAGFVSFAALYATVDKLKDRGSFRDGVFTWADPAGKQHRKDGYEAAWEEINRLELHYPQPRFQGPVIINPDAFSWLPVAANAGVNERHLAAFHERGITLSQLKIETGCSFEIPPDKASSLLFVYEGMGSVDDLELRKHSAIKMEPGESPRIIARSELHLQQFTLPQF